MMSFHLSQSQIVLIAVACLTALVVLAWPADGAKGQSGAHWYVSSEQPIQCSSTGRICAEWIVEGNIEWICCLEPGQLYMGLEACPNPRRPQI